MITDDRDIFPVYPIAIPRGIVIRFYPGKLSDHEVANLADLAEMFADTAPTFATWLGNWCDSEAARRIDGDEGSNAPDAFDNFGHGHVREADFPRFPTRELTNADVAEALTVLTAMSYGLEDLAAGEFIDRLTNAIVAVAANRLKQSK